ncbi:hypothetical protein SO802_000043 [Lithocarpus litseifolius]|uniref:DUF4283 domain-containing protein n=1 Tax=Lithocarpus litseifolius TaxID=425828 RepID=A0AAW2DS79_9ROSI
MSAPILSREEEAELARSNKKVKDLKACIPSPWRKSLIVKVYGRAVGFSLLHGRLLSLWKPMGKIDCIDLEDCKGVLRNGPWFIGENFLSIRSWEPNFKPAETNISSVAIWVRLNKHPIEYYHVEALQIIGNAIGKVLRIDTHTANESRGRFARLCIQVDVGKPLTTTLLIGGKEQPMCYEGIQRLCFSCERIGHQCEKCPYIVWKDASQARETKRKKDVVVSQKDVVHALDNSGTTSGTSKDRGSYEGMVGEDGGQCPGRV